MLVVPNPLIQHTCFKALLQKTCFMSVLSSVAATKHAGNLQQADPRKTSATIPAVCVVLSCPCVLPKVGAHVLVETLCKSCRAGQKPTTHSQFSLLIVACAIRMNHSVVCQIYLHLFLKFHKACFTRLGNSKHLFEALLLLMLPQALQENQDSLLKEVGDQVTAETVLVLNAVFASVFSTTVSRVSVLCEREEKNYQGLVRVKLGIIYKTSTQGTESIGQDELHHIFSNVWDQKSDKCFLVCLERSKLSFFLVCSPSHCHAEALSLVPPRGSLPCMETAAELLFMYVLPLRACALSSTTPMKEKSQLQWF